MAIIKTPVCKTLVSMLLNVGVNVFNVRFDAFSRFRMGGMGTWVELWLFCSAVWVQIQSLETSGYLLVNLNFFRCWPISLEI